MVLSCSFLPIINLSCKSKIPTLLCKLFLPTVMSTMHPLTQTIATSLLRLKTWWKIRSRKKTWAPPRPSLCSFPSHNSLFSSTKTTTVMKLKIINKILMNIIKLIWHRLFQLEWRVNGHVEILRNIHGYRSLKMLLTMTLVDR
mgnify:CR=1 FL=1